MVFMSLMVLSVLIIFIVANYVVLIYLIDLWCEICNDHYYFVFVGLKHFYYK